MALHFNIALNLSLRNLKIRACHLIWTKLIVPKLFIILSGIHDLLTLNKMLDWIELNCKIHLLVKKKGTKYIGKKIKVRTPGFWF